MHTKRILCMGLIFAILIGIAGCIKKEKPYPYGRYTRQEVLDLFHQNRDVFDELVSTILEDSYFLENGDVDPERRTWIMPSDDRYLELFNERSKEAILKILRFKPYMITYDFSAYHSSEKDIIKITFIGDGVEDESFSFQYLVDQSDLRANEEYIKYREQDYYVSQLSDGWIFVASPV